MVDPSRRTITCSLLGNTAMLTFMAKSNLASMSVDALLKLRDDVGTALSRRADELKNQLSRLGGEIGHTKR
jgi:hypothetical protein